MSKMPDDFQQRISEGMKTYWANRKSRKYPRTKAKLQTLLDAQLTRLILMGDGERDTITEMTVDRLTRRVRAIDRATEFLGWGWAEADLEEQEG
jgi:hypothetical protein